MASLIPLLTLLTVGLMLALAAARLSSSSLPILHYWSKHPWRIFWSSLLIVVIGMILLNVGASWTAWFFLICGFLIMYISVIQGLKSTYGRSPRRAALVVLAALAMGFANPIRRFAESRDTHALDTDAFTVIVGILFWILLTFVALRSEKRIIAQQRNRSGQPKGEGSS